MIDVHSHVLPGLDDGAGDMEQSVAMCRLARQDGTRAIVATPHFYRGIFDTPDVSRCAELCSDLQQRCRREFDPEFRVLRGSDCHFHPEMIENLRDNRIPTLNDGRYLLVEFPERRIPPGFERVLFELCLAGARPVITHPERQRELAADPEILRRLVERGCYAQVTAGSLTGEVSPEATAAASEMVKRHLVQVIASDAHGIEHRPPGLSAARDRAAALVGEELARRMVEDVPAAMIADEDFDFPAPLPAASARESGRRPLWRRLLGV